MNHIQFFEINKKFLVIENIWFYEMPQYNEDAHFLQLIAHSNKSTIEAAMQFHYMNNICITRKMLCIF